jgi:hypothetical protein
MESPSSFSHQSKTTKKPLEKRPRKPFNNKPRLRSMPNKPTKNKKTITKTQDGMSSS